MRAILPAPPAPNPAGTSPSAARRGQPTRYNTRLRAAILRDIEEGVPVSKAFRCNGISPRTGFNWKRFHPEFARAVAAARERYHAHPR